MKEQKTYVVEKRNDVTLSIKVTSFFIGYGVTARTLTLTKINDVLHYTLDMMNRDNIEVASVVRVWHDTRIMKSQTTEGYFKCLLDLLIFMDINDMTLDEFPDDQAREVKDFLKEVGLSLELKNVAFTSSMSGLRAVTYHGDLYDCYFGFTIDKESLNPDRGNKNMKLKDVVLHYIPKAEEEKDRTYIYFGKQVDMKEHFIHTVHTRFIKEWRKTTELTEFTIKGMKDSLLDDLKTVVESGQYKEVAYLIGTFLEGNLSDIEEVLDK